ncbi:MAG TPA: hypothetical protein VKE69_08040 [Planctomycetota bacterium]|nr:hypothetical protein [Planctomycetota bacterium]
MPTQRKEMAVDSIRAEDEYAGASDPGDPRHPIRPYERITDDRAFGEALKSLLFDPYLRRHGASGTDPSASPAISPR